MPKDPSTEKVAKAEQNVTKAKTKKNKRKKKQASKSGSSMSSSSASETASLPPLPVDETAKEEFYDAHESYHALSTDNQIAGPVAKALDPTKVEHEHDLKIQSITTPAVSQEQTVTVANKEASVISKPVTGLE